MTDNKQDNEKANPEGKEKIKKKDLWNYSGGRRIDSVR